MKNSKNFLILLLVIISLFFFYGKIGYIGHPVRLVVSKDMAKGPATQPSLSSFQMSSLENKLSAPWHVPIYNPYSLIVQLKEGADINGVINALTGKFNIKDVKELFPMHEDPLLKGTYVLEINSISRDGDSLDAVRILKLDPELKLKYAEPNFIATAEQTLPFRLPLPTPNDPLYNQQWAIPKISVLPAWYTLSGLGGGFSGNRPIIAVIDTGIYYSHPDLGANIWINPGEIQYNNIDDDNNGYIDDVIGYDFVETVYPCWSGGPSNPYVEDCDVEDNNPIDAHGHGTHVGGIIAAIPYNNIGVIGICPVCKVMIVRAGFGSSYYYPSYPYPAGLLEYDDIAQAIIYATDNGAKIISMSFGGSNDMAMRNAINYAYNHGVILVAAAGNYNTDAPLYPGAYTNVIGVAATDQNDQRASFSNYGYWVDIAAPGVNIMSTLRPFVQLSSTCGDLSGTGYGSCSGTSMATPTISAVIGLILIKFPTITQDQVWTLVHSSYDPLNLQNFIGIGRINAYKSVSPVSMLTARFSSSMVDGQFMPFPSANIFGTANGPNFLNYRVDYGAGIYPTSWITIQADTFTPVNNGLLATMNTAGLPTGLYTLRLLATDIYGSVFENRMIVRIDQDLVAGWPKIITPGEFTAASPTIIDVNGDGRSEVFFHSFTHQPFTYGIDRIYAIDFNGISLPGWPIVMPQTAAPAILSPAVANIDSDSNFEIVGASNTNPATYRVYETNGLLQSGWPINVPGLFSIYRGFSPTIANIDGGSDYELILLTGEYCGTNYNNKVYVFKQNGQLVPGWPQSIYCPPDYGTPAVGDIDNNGDLEIVISSSTNYYPTTPGRLYVFNHDGTPFSGWPIITDTGGGLPTSPILADIDQNDNGKLEIVVYTRIGTTVYNHDGSIVPGWPKPYGGWYFGVPAVGDIDNNGDLEIVIGARNSQTSGWLYVVKKDGSIYPGWPKLINHSFNFLATYYKGSPIIVDLNGDGMKEILVGVDNILYGFNRNGSPLNSFPKILYDVIQGSVAVGNIDGDNKIDVFAIDQSGTMYLWEFNGPLSQQVLQWPMFHHDPKHTGKYP